ncbi:MAG: pyrroline-5-carboxylate reductase [Chloroflexi bacterium]|nr:pyrroline-5-carboxylate reductase [Chloroflexota bacterium]
MLSNTTIAFVGAGAMAEAMIGGLIEQNVVSPGDIVASGPRAERGQALAQKYGIRVTASNREAVAGAGVVVLSVKPQMLGTVASELHGRIPPGALVLSILAGTRIETIGKALLHSGIVRSMPNTPAQIGQGITVWTASSDVSDVQRKQAEAVLLACGPQVYVDDEDYLDMATAISGNGPAYVFLFMEAMVDAAVHLGFSRQIAEQLVLQTVKGTAEYALKSGRHLAGMRNQVTSPGGTSAEALYYLEKAGFRTAVSRAIWAGYQRAVQLGRGKKRSQLAEEKG